MNNIYKEFIDKLWYKYIDIQNDQINNIWSILDKYAFCYSKMPLWTWKTLINIITALNYIEKWYISSISTKSTLFYNYEEYFSKLNIPYLNLNHIFTNLYKSFVNDYYLFINKNLLPT